MCGKSTLFGYFVQLINTQELFQKDYCILKREDCLIIPCFIDAPKGEPASLLYFWVSIIDSLAEEGMDFLEKFTLLLSIKCLEILWKKNIRREELTSILSMIVPITLTSELKYYISSMHWLDALTPPLEEHLSKLAQKVSRLLEVL